MTGVQTCALPIYSVAENNIFDSGRLLDDLIKYVYSGDNYRMILLGDTAQLMTVGQNYSPTLNRKVLEKSALDITEYTLTEVVRQASDSGILANATHLRYLLDNTVYRNPQITTNFPDITSITGVELIDSIYVSR